MSVYSDFVYPAYERVLSDVPGCDKYKVSVSVMENVDAIPDSSGIVKIFSMLPFIITDEQPAQAWFFDDSGFHGWKNDPFVFRISDMNVHGNVFDTRPEEEGVFLKNQYFFLSYGVSNGSDTSDFPVDLETKVVFDYYSGLVDFTFDRDCVLSRSNFDFACGKGDACVFTFGLFNFGQIPGDSVHFGIKLDICYNFYVPKGFDFKAYLH